MRGITTLRIALAGAAILIAGSLACAQGPGGLGAPGGPPMVRAFGIANRQFWNNPNIVQQLNLTVEQRKAMDGILQDHRMKLVDLRANLQRAELTLEPMLKADTPDRKAIEAQIDKIVTARADLERANSLYLLDIRMQLNAGQWKQLQTLRMQRMQRMGAQGRGNWGPGANGPDGQFRQSAPGGQPPAGAPQSIPDTAPAPGAGSGGIQ